MFIVLSAREQNPNLTIISRASEAKSYTKLKKAGADNVIMPDKVGGSHMASLVVTPDVVEFLDNISVEGTGDVNLEEFIIAKDELSGADIKAMCSEAGLVALRERRMKVQMSDFRQSKDKCLYRKKGNIPDGLYI